MPEGATDEVIDDEQVTTPVDALDLGGGDADFEGVTRPAFMLTFEEDGCLDHPFLVNMGTPLPICAQAGDRLYSWTAPLSSQPPNDAVPFVLTPSSGILREDLDAFDIRIRSGFRAQTPSADPNTYVPQLTHSENSTFWQRGTIVPRLVEMTFNLPSQGSVVIRDSVRPASMCLALSVLLWRRGLTRTLLSSPLHPASFHRLHVT